jgi:hypothetical protein
VRLNTEEIEMGNHLAVIEPLALPDRRNPAQMPSLPAWLLQRSAALGNAMQPDSTGTYREMAVLPPALILSSSERRMVESHIDGLGTLLDLDQAIDLRGKTLSNDQAHATMIAALCMKGGTKLDTASSDALTEDYLDAIEDLPAWAVREAIRKWNRAESPKLDGKSHNYEFRPSPPTLRRLAQHELAPIRARILQLHKVLNAQPLIEYSEEHRRDMLERLQNLMREIAPKRVDSVPPLTQEIVEAEMAEKLDQPAQEAAE